MIIALQIVETWRPLETVENHALQLFLRSTSVLFSCIITKRDDYKTKVKQKKFRAITTCYQSPALKALTGLSEGCNLQDLHREHLKLVIIMSFLELESPDFFISDYENLEKMNSEFRYRVISIAPSVRILSHSISTKNMKYWLSILQ